MVLSAAFSPRGDRLVTTGRDASRLWNTATGRTHPRAERAFGQHPRCGVQPVGRPVRDGRHRLRPAGFVWDGATGELGATLLGHTNAIESASFSGDGTLIETASRDGSARISDVDTGSTELQLLRPPRPGERRGVQCRREHPPLRERRRDVEAVERTARPVAAIHRRSTKAAAAGIAFSPRRTLARDGRDRQAPRGSGALVGAGFTTFDHHGPVTSVAFGPGGTTLLTGVYRRRGTDLVNPRWHDHPVLRWRGEGPSASAAFDAGGTRW